MQHDVRLLVCAWAYSVLHDCITFAPFRSPVINGTDACMVVWRRCRFEVTFDEIRRADDKLFGAKVHALAAESSGRFERCYCRSASVCGVGVV